MQDMNQAIAILDATKHWKLECENNTKRGRHYSWTVWNGGKRVTSYARTPLMAATAAMVKLRDKAAGTRFKVVR